MHEYKYTEVQKLPGLNNQRRLEFCRIIVDQLEENPDFFKQILWNGEMSFNLSIPPNLKNTKYINCKIQMKLQIKRSGWQSIDVW